MVRIGRRTTFNAAHRLFNEKWTDEKNKAVFGKCFSPNYHGHNYVLETWVEGDINPETGFIINLSDLKLMVKEEIEEAFDHRNLNLDVPEFKNLNPTAENIAKVIYSKLKPRLKDFKVTIRLYETQNNMVEYTED